MPKQPENIVYIAIYACIDGKAAEELTNIIATKIPKDTQILYLLISTGGGSVFHGFALYNLLRGLSYKIITYNIGDADSIGNVLMMAGEERYAAGNAVFLIHGVHSEVKEQQKITSAFLQEKLSCIQSDEDRIRATIVKHSNIALDELNRFFCSGIVQDAQYALKHGMIHAIKELELPLNAVLFTVMASIK